MSSLSNASRCLREAHHILLAQPWGPLKTGGWGLGRILSLWRNQFCVLLTTPFSCKVTGSTASNDRGAFLAYSCPTRTSLAMAPKAYPRRVVSSPGPYLAQGVDSALCPHKLAIFPGESYPSPGVLQIFHETPSIARAMGNKALTLCS